MFIPEGEKETDVPCNSKDVYRLFWHRCNRRGYYTLKILVVGGGNPRLVSLF